MPLLLSLELWLLSPGASPGGSGLQLQRRSGESLWGIAAVRRRVIASCTFVFGHRSLLKGGKWDVRSLALVLTFSFPQSVVMGDDGSVELPLSYASSAQPPATRWRAFWGTAGSVTRGEGR